MTEHPDIHPIRVALDQVQKEAKTLDWAAERPWRTDSHVWEEGGVVTVDLHDLNASLAKRVLALTTEMGPDLEGGGIIFVTGQGRHSVGLPVLKSITVGMLVRLERERGWRQRDLGAGRVLLAVDEERLPGRYGPGTPLWIPAFFIFFCGALAWTLPLKVGLPLVVVAIWFGLGVWRAGRKT